ncbi:hypothetical protein BDR07DRAFT_146827 [Suillus spraguei]|nr:hypothetical protein BDR07DRAFT_146827 [Suillus spraguei]
MQQHGMGASFHLPSLFSNISSILQLEIGNTDNSPSLWKSKLIESTLCCAETHILRELKYRAHIAVPGSYTLLGVSDEWDCLREGEIYATVFDERTGFVQYQDMFLLSIITYLSYTFHPRSYFRSQFKRSSNIQRP